MRKAGKLNGHNRNRCMLNYAKAHRSRNNANFHSQNKKITQNTNTSIKKYYK